MTDPEELDFIPDGTLVYSRDAKRTCITCRNFRYHPSVVCSCICVCIAHQGLLPPHGQSLFACRSWIPSVILWFCDHNITWSQEFSCSMRILIFHSIPPLRYFRQSLSHLKSFVVPSQDSVGVSSKQTNIICWDSFLQLISHIRGSCWIERVMVS